MMPQCNYKGCKQVADEYVGKLKTPDVDAFGKNWENPLYLCKKHAKKIRKLLGIQEIK